MKIQIITLFPEMFEGPLSHSMLLKAQKQGIAQFEIINLREYGEGDRKTVDDTPYGGGDGMLLKPGPVVEAIEAAKQSAESAHVILLTPRGPNLVQSKAQSLADKNHDLVLVCGRYEGFDERIREFVDEEISIGNYVLTGGEVPALVIVDSVVRLLPGVLGGESSAEIESFSDDRTVEFPQYTRPEDFRGLKVPEILLSGDHGRIAQWRKDQSSDLSANRHRSTVDGQG